MKKTYISPVSRAWIMRSKENMMNSASITRMTFTKGSWDDELSVKEEEDNTVSIWDLY